MHSKNISMLVFILVLFGFAFWLIWPLDSTRLGRQGLRLGLDLKGGTHLTYQADLSKKDPSLSDAAVMEGIRQTIERRVNAYGVTEPVIQIQGDNRVIVQLPGIRNIEEAVKLIGKTAELVFKEQVLDPQGRPELDEKGQLKWKPATATGSDGQERTLTGQYFIPNAHVAPGGGPLGAPVLNFEFDREGGNLFKQITTRLAPTKAPLGISLDNEVISAPRVQSVIEDRGIIEGLTLEEGRLLAIQLNSGALQAPLKIIQQQDVDPTLGADSMQKSLIAGIIGLIMVLVFMAVYYKLPGLLADAALLVYGALVLAIFKMIPVTLTLAGIAAFIISIGMAVDANVLIFERMKEELRAGKTLGAAIDAGFNRAWTAIRDSNISTFITCAILYWFGSRFVAGSVMGFALTLFIGVVVSMFSAIFITHTFLRLILNTPLAKKTGLFIR
ncbi:MAG: protein translocase subunit SecD [Chloroflexi bacterium]|nr:protein translocase subunit SecD [Chloroflexota bacterium]